MSKSSDAGHFFQTDSALSEVSRKEEKSKNQAGNPIKLPSKLLAVIADPWDDGAIYVAEAAGTVKRIVLETSTRTETYIPTASALPGPITSITISVSKSLTTLFAGSWDKNIYAWPLPPISTPKRSSPVTIPSSATLTGHTDFVKTLLALPVLDHTSPPLLLSGSSDATIIVWNALTFQKLHVLTGHSRAVQALALDVYSVPEYGFALPAAGIVVFSGDSNREIRAWHISSASSYEVSTDTVAADNVPTPGDAAAAGTTAPLVVHETSIFGLVVTSSGDLWTASADRSAKCLSRERKFAADTTLQHPDYVRCVAVSERQGVVVTGCRDEQVRVWDSGSGECLATLEGHWEEVTGCVVLGKQGEWVATVGIDGTLRRWSLGKEDLKRVAGGGDGAKGVVVEEEPRSKLTEDEERELAELMDDSD